MTVSPIAPYSAAGDAARDRGVEQPGAVEVDDQAQLARGLGDGRQLVERPHAAAGAAMRLLEHDDARRLQVVGDPHDVAQLVGRDPAAVAR